MHRKVPLSRLPGLQDSLVRSSYPTRIVQRADKYNGRILFTLWKDPQPNRSLTGTQRAAVLRGLLPRRQKRASRILNDRQTRQKKPSRIRRRREQREHPKLNPQRQTRTSRQGSRVQMGQSIPLTNRKCPTNPDRPKQDTHETERANPPRARTRHCPTSQDKKQLNCISKPPTFLPFTFLKIPTTSHRASRFNPE